MTLKQKSANDDDFIYVLANAVAIDNFVRDAEYLTDKSGIQQLQYMTKGSNAEVANLEGSHPNT